MLRRQLVKEGCEDVLLACDGKEGLELLASRPSGSVDCILMDIEVCCIAPFGTLSSVGSDVHPLILP